MACLKRFVAFRVESFWNQLCYLLFLSFLGFFSLKLSKPKTKVSLPKDIDLFFMSVSSVTVSSMSTVEMEEFSNTQLVFMTILMLLGGEVFISMLGIEYEKSKFRKFENKVDVISANFIPTNAEAQIELPSVPSTNLENSGSRPSKNIIFKLMHQFQKLKFRMFDNKVGANLSKMELGLVPVTNLENTGNHPSNNTDLMATTGEDYLKYKSLCYLGYVILAYLVVAHVGGYILVLVYISLSASVGDVLGYKRLQLHTFSVFTVVSTFANCGFVPTNENMVIFKNNSGLLLILIPQVLFGNTCYPACLRCVIWVLGRLTGREELQFILNNRKELGYHHLLPSRHSFLLAITVFGLIIVQLLLFCCMEWNSGALDGMGSYQKIVGALFQSVNTRHTGESIVDLSIISPAVLVLFGFMMYLPPYTSFLLVNDDEMNDKSSEKRYKRGHVVNDLLFSQLSCLVIFVILICISERKRMKDDPLNFTLLNITIEVVSAYGNVGFTTGYSCERQINRNNQCKDTWCGFSGRWSNEGKIILILIMIFGKLKKFSMGKGKAWKLS